MVKAGIITALCALSSPAEACRLALILAMDVSSSVDDTEDRLQREGLANALLSRQVQDAFFISPEPVALHIFEWSGRSHQTSVTRWQMIQSPADLLAVATQLRTAARSNSGLPTAMGHALGYAAIQLGDVPECLFRTIDIAGDGPNNAGFGPASVYATFPLDGVTVNGLVITGSDPAALAYYQSTVIRGAGAFVEVANGFDDFEDAMRRKLVRELSAQVIGRATTTFEDKG